VGKTAQVDLDKNGTYIVKDGKMIEIDAPQSGHGKQIISWQGNKPCSAMVEVNLKFQ
jgi:hypothetical protein